MAPKPPDATHNPPHATIGGGVESFGTLGDDDYIHADPAVEYVHVETPVDDMTAKVPLGKLIEGTTPTA